MLKAPIRRRVLRDAAWPALAATAMTAAVLMAADPAWKDKPIPSWTEADAQQILTNSPWSKAVTAGLTSRQTEDQRREGGDMGQPHGVGYDGVDNGPKAQLPKSVGDLVRARPYEPPAPQSIKLQLRWESALPVKAAELKSHVVEPPTLEGEGYSLAVYGIPGESIKGDPKTLGDPLKKTAVLKREGKKDARPSSVEVFVREGGVVVVYLFPLSADISTKDERVEFNAQIGRIVINQAFNLGDMMFQGKLSL